MDDSTNDAEREPTLARLVVLNADVSGSTRLYEQYGDAVARRDIAVCLDLLGAVARRHGGRVLRTIGDEIVCSFPVPRHALQAAREMQEALRVASAAGQFTSGNVRVKIGWHYGVAEWRGAELVGATPATAQAVIARAKPEEILASGAAVAALPPELRDTAQLIDTVESHAVGATLAVYKLPWEQDEDVTVFKAQSAAATASVSRLLVLRQGARELRLDDAHRHCRIGRTADNDLVVAGRFTSRRHAEIDFRHGRFYLADMSINGTVVEPCDGATVHLHREVGVLSGDGVLILGDAAAGDAAQRVSYHCE